ncbi:Phospholipase A2-like protein 3 [Nymphaea thermarum]|nr:Phospholipase A2-like protein 3 [Nymphaea thermarum]
MTGCCRLNVVIIVMVSSLSLSSLLHRVQGLNLGFQDSALQVYSNAHTGCSRTCHSEFCSVPPFLRYGKYCGIMYTGCAGERPCDSLDACCQKHDACVEAKNNYLDLECNEELLQCVATVRDSGAEAFRGSTCLLAEVADVISAVIQAALIAGGVIHH